jgi:hypothetical protein
MSTKNNLLLRFNQTDFRATAVGQFQLLISFCQISQKTIDDTLFQLITTDHIDTRLMSHTYSILINVHQHFAVIHTMDIVKQSIFLKHFSDLRVVY